MPTTKDRQIDPYAIDHSIASLKGIGQWHYDLRTRRYTGSAECCALRGIHVSAGTKEYTALEWSSGIHVSDRKRVESAFERLHRAADTHISVRYRIWSDSAHWRWVMTRAAVADFGTDMQPLTISGVDIDVADIYEEQAENKHFREEAARSEIALASAEQGLWHVDLRLGIRVENDTWRIMRGYAADSDYNSIRDWESDIHPDDVAWVMNNTKIRDDQTSDIIDYSYRQRHANGEWQWIWSRGKIMERDADNSPVVFIGTDTDITHIKEAETRYERLSNTLEIAVRTAGMGVWEWTLNSQANFWDRRTHEIFGTEDNAQMVTHSQFLSMVHHDDRKNLEDVLAQAVSSRTDINVDYRIVHPAKGIRYLEAKATCHLTVGELPRYVGIVWDVTDTVEAAQESAAMAESLSHAQRLQSIGELTGGIAHDVNNLLAIISGNAELMALSLGEESQFLKAILSASGRGADLTQSLLAFSRKQSLKPAPVDLQILIDNLCAMLGRTLGSMITLNPCIEDETWQCMADSVQLENALVNLIVNARDAMSKEGTVTISVKNCYIDKSFISLTRHSMSGEFVQLSIADSGCGMSREVLNKSIDPFFTTKNVGDGHGLGLSMVFGFINQSDGHMTIDSVQGQGTTVSLYLPRHNSGEQKIQPSEQQSDPLPTGQGETILLVEDEPSVQQMIADALDILGYGTVRVNTASDALHKLEQQGHEIDLIVSDVVLPGGINGLELGAEVKKPFPGARVLFISGYAQDALAQCGTDVNEVEVLHKPFSIRKLAEQISKLLDT